MADKPTNYDTWKCVKCSHEWHDDKHTGEGEDPIPCPQCGSKSVMHSYPIQSTNTYIYKKKFTSLLSDIKKAKRAFVIDREALEEEKTSDRWRQGVIDGSQTTDRQIIEYLDKLIKKYDSR